jgi:hypothetical protein
MNVLRPHPLTPHPIHTHKVVLTDRVCEVGDLIMLMASAPPTNANANPNDGGRGGGGGGGDGGGGDLGGEAALDLVWSTVSDLVTRCELVIKS